MIYFFLFFDPNNMFILCEIKDLDVLCRSGFLYELGDLQQILIGYTKIIELPAKVIS